jgi:hypothetical protein
VVIDLQYDALMADKVDPTDLHEPNPDPDGMEDIKSLCKQIQ